MTLQDLLSLPQAILIGSRALGVAKPNSDYDIVIPLSSIPTMLQERLDTGGDFSIERYFSKIPSLGRGWFFDYVFVSGTKAKVQILVEHKRASGSKVKELYTISIPDEKIHLYKDKLGKEISVEVGIISKQFSFYGV